MIRKLNSISLNLRENFGDGWEVFNSVVLNNVSAQPGASTDFPCRVILMA